MSDAFGPMFVAIDEQHDVAIDLTRWKALTEGTLRHEGVAAGELNLLFVTESAMHELNGTHMSKDGATDVLSFPLDAADVDDPVVGETLIGDIVVCPAYAARQAADHAGDRGHRGSLDDEIALLVVHGVLHIVGWDHGAEDEAAVMQAREDELLDLLHR